MKFSLIDIILILLAVCLIITGIAFWQSGVLAGFIEDNNILLSWLIPVIFIIFGVLTSLIAWFILFIAAFNDGPVTGLLFCFLLPFYPLYFAFSRYKSKNKGFVLIGWIGGILLAIFSEILFPVSFFSVISNL